MNIPLQAAASIGGGSRTGDGDGPRSSCGRHDAGDDFERSLREGRHRRGRAEAAQALPGSAPAPPFPGNATATRLIDWRAPRPCQADAYPSAGKAVLEGSDSMPAAVLDVVGRTAGMGPRGRRSDGTGDEEADSGPEESGDLLRTDPFGPPIARSGAPPLAPQGAVSTSQAGNPGPTQAALETALGAPPAAPGSIAAARWEVSIPHASGVPLDVRAGRTDHADGSAGWTLDIRSSARELRPALARSASRLTDRLAARSLHAHVRIEDEQQDLP